MENVEQAILALAGATPPGDSFAPADVAQKLDPVAWRSKLTAVRRAAVRMALRGELEILRKGKPAPNPAEVRGVIRLRRPPNLPEAAIEEADNQS